MENKILLYIFIYLYISLSDFVNIYISVAAATELAWILCYRYTPEELHAMVDLKPEKKDDD